MYIIPNFLFEGQETFLTLSTSLNEHAQLLLIHGNGGNHLSWPPDMHHTQEYPVIAIDLLGHGRSSGAGSDNPSDFARAVVALLDELAISRAIGEGHTMGGGGAQFLYGIHADFAAYNKLDVLDSIGYWSSPTTVICGEFDRLMPPKCSCYLADKVAGATLEIVPAPGHMVMLERAAVVGVVVDRFLDAVT